MYEIKYRSEDEMKDSEIEWLGMIPRDWEISQFKRYININSGREITDEEDKNCKKIINVYGSGGVFKKTSNILYSGEAILFGRKGTIGKPIYVNEDFWTVDTMYFSTCNNEFLPKMLYYQLLIVPWSLMSTQTALPSIVGSDIGSLYTVVPKLDNQQKIANFLDIKTAEFDSIISKKELLIEKLEEAKKSLISEVVTGKVKIVNGELVERKPDEMKDSGIEWLEMIPKDWEVTKLKYVSKLNMGQSPDSNSINQDGLGMPFLQGKSEFGTKYPEAINYCTKPRKKSLRGEILISVRAPVGDLNFSVREYCIGRGLASIGSSENIDYIYYFMLAYKDILRSYSTGSTFEAVSIGQIENFNIIKTDVETKNMIARFLNIKSKNINSIITKTKLQIEKLKEAKQSLISEAVTGKIDLRDWEIEEI